MKHLLFHNWKLINWTENLDEVIVHYDNGIGNQTIYWRLETYVCRGCGKRKEVKVYHSREVASSPEYIKRWGRQNIINHAMTC